VLRHLHGEKPVADGRPRLQATGMAAAFSKKVRQASMAWSGPSQGRARIAWPAGRSGSRKFQEAAGRIVTCCFPKT
jgi:hypothetical protein